MKRIKTSAFLFVVTVVAIVFFIAPSVLGQARPVSGRKKVIVVWEGDISVKRVHVSADGVGNWTANYYVRLREDCGGIANAKQCLLQPLELKYEIEANEVLDKNYFGVYPPGCYAPPNQPSGCPHTPAVPHNRSVIGKASGTLRLEGTAPDEFKFAQNLDGGIYKDKQPAVPPPADARPDPRESDAERYWNSCMAGVPEVTGQPAYRIKINMISGYGSNDLRSNSDQTPEVLNPLLKGIVRSGPDLQEGKGNLQPRDGYAGPVLDFWLCGKLRSPDAAEMSGEHTFSSFSNNIDQLYSGPTQVSITWNLKRKQVDSQDPTTKPTKSDKPDKPEDPEKPGKAGLLPADLALTAEPSPGTARLGETISYKFDIKNNGPADASGVMFTFVLGNAALVEAAAGQGGCTGAGGRVTCRLGTLKAGETAYVTLRLMPRVAGALTYTARVTSASPDLDPSNNAKTVTVRIQPKN